MNVTGNHRPLGQEGGYYSRLLRQYSSLVQRVRWPRKGNLEGFKLRSATLESYQKCWKPATLRVPTLLSLVAFPLILALTLEALARKSKAQERAAVAEQALSPSVSFAFFYLPTILAISYGLVWTWVDLDIKRLEPYFQMSKVEGASFQESVQLHYPFDLLFFLPTRAMYRKHWVVMLASTISLINFCGFTPIIGSVFKAQKITRQVPGDVITTARIPPVANQSLMLNSGFLLNTYGILWLNQELPAFTARNGSIIPFKISSKSQNLDAFDFLKAPSDMYSSALECASATITNDSQGFVYSHAGGCSISDGEISGLIPNITGLFASLFPACENGNSTYNYVAYSFMNSKPLYLTQDNEENSNYAESPENIRYRWAASRQKTVLFCQASYQVQRVNVTLTSTMALSNIKPVSQPSPLPANVLDTNIFQRFLTNKTIEESFTSPRADMNETIQQIDSARLKKLGMTDNLGGNIMILAVGCSQLEASSYLEAKILAESLDCAYRVMFSVALNSLFLKDASNSTGIPGIAIKDLDAVVMVYPLTIALEVILCVIATLSAIVLAMCWRRNSEMVKDPASLSNVLELMDSGESVAISHQIHHNLRKTCNATLRRGKLSLRTTTSDCTFNSDMDKSQKRTRRNFPSAMSVSVGIALTSVLFAALLIVIIMLLLSWKRKGLELPSNKSAVNQIVLNYIPVTFATFLEPVWTWLNRKLCLMKPFDNLSSGQAKASQSMDLKYTSIPPQMTIWRALKAGHFLLAAACGVGLSANILAVTLNNLFYSSTGHVEMTEKFSRTLLPTMTSNPLNISGSDHIYMASANISHGAPLPAWVTRDRYILPFKAKNESRIEPVRSYKALTPGIGVNVTCSQLEWDDPALLLVGNIVAQPQIHYTDETGVPCIRAWDTFYNSWEKSNGSLELLAPLLPSSENATDYDHQVCGSILAAGFSRATLNADAEGANTIFTSSTWMTCKSIIVSETYNVRVNASQKVEQFERYPIESSQLTYTDNSSLISVLSSLYKAFDSPFNKHNYWHNDTIKESWPGFLVKALSNSESFVDPKLRSPSFDQVGPVVEDLIRRLFPLILSLQPSLLAEATPNDTVTGTIWIQRTRVFVSWPMAFVTILLLILNTVVAVMYYAYRPKPLPTGTPETLASLLTLFEGSGLVQERPRNGVWPSNWLFGYGKFTSVTDGKSKLGIERKPFVVAAP